MIDKVILAAIVSAFGGILAAVLGNMISSRRKKGDGPDARTVIALDAAKLVIEMHSRAVATVNARHSTDLRAKNQIVKQLRRLLDECNETVSGLTKQKPN